MTVQSGDVELEHMGEFVTVDKNEIGQTNKTLKPSKESLTFLQKNESVQWVRFTHETVRYLYFYTDNTDELTKRLKSLNTLKEDSLERRITEAEIYHDLGRITESHTLFKRIEEKVGDNPRVLTGLAVTSLQKGKWEKANNLLNRIRKKTPGYNSPQFIAAQSVILIHENSLGKAGELLKEGMTFHEDISLKAAYSNWLLVSGEVEKAIEFTSLERQQSGSSSILSSLLIDAARLSGKNNSISDLLKRILEMVIVENKSNAGIAEEISSGVHKYHGVLKESLYSCLNETIDLPELNFFKKKKFLEKENLDQLSLLHLNRVNECKRRIELAILDKDGITNQFSALTFLNRAMYELKYSGNEQQVLSLLEKAFSRSPENPHIAASLGKQLRVMGRYRRALDLFQYFHEKGFINTELQYQYGSLLSQIGRDSKAKRHFALADEKTEEIDARPGKGISHFKRGEDEEAFEHLIKGVMAHPDAENYMYLAIAYYQKNYISEALKHLKKAKHADPMDPTPYILESIIYNESYTPYQAILSARESEKRIRANGRGILDIIAATKRGLSNVGSSLQSFGLDFWSFKKSQDILSLDPYDADAHLFPGYVYTRVGNFYSGESEYIQGVLMDPSAIIERKRLNPIIKIPEIHFNSSGMLSAEGKETGEEESISLSGYSGEPYKIDFSIESSQYNNLFLNRSYNSGSVNKKGSGRLRGKKITAMAGWQPHFSTDFFSRFRYSGSRESSSRYLSQTDIDLLHPYSYYTNSNKTNSSEFFYDGGLHYRAGPTSHFLLRPYYVQLNSATSSTGRINPFVPANSYPAQVDIDIEMRERGLQIKHFLDVKKKHRVSVGAEYFQRYMNANDNETVDFPFLLPDLVYRNQTKTEQMAWKLYIRDKWKILSFLTLDLGGSFQSNRIERESEQRNPKFCPRVGAEMKATSRDTFRIGYRKDLIPNLLPYSDFNTGQLERVDVAGLLPSDYFFTSIDQSSEDYRFRWEREWSDTLFHFNDIGFQNIENNAEFKMVYTGVNWIAHPRIGVQLLHIHVQDIEYDKPPFAFDMPSKESILFKISYIDPRRLRVTFWEEYYSKKESYYHEVPEIDSHFRTILEVLWESPAKRYGLAFNWFNVLNQKRQTHPGISENDKFISLSIETRL